MQYQVFTSSVPHNVKDVIRNVAPDAQTIHQHPVIAASILRMDPTAFWNVLRESIQIAMASVNHAI